MRTFALSISLLMLISFAGAENNGNSAMYIYISFYDKTYYVRTLRLLLYFLVFVLKLLSEILILFAFIE